PVTKSTVPPSGASPAVDSAGPSITGCVFHVIDFSSQVQSLIRWIAPPEMLFALTRLSARLSPRHSSAADPAVPAASAGRIRAESGHADNWHFAADPPGEPPDVCAVSMRGWNAPAG